MLSLQTPLSKDAIEQELLKRFRQAAVSPEGLFDYPTGRAGLKALQYPDEIMAGFPDQVAHCYCGVGNPFAPGAPAQGEQLLDVGCGAGVDALVAAVYVGPEGRVEGLEMSPDMLERARANVQLAQAVNVTLHLGGAEHLPFADAAFDRVISNGVYNLVPDKPRALAEVFRILKSGGQFQVADQIKESEASLGLACPLPPPGISPQAHSWAR